MRFAKSFWHGVAGCVALVVWICAAMVVCDERCSRDLDMNDLVWHEYEDNVKPRRGFTQESPLRQGGEEEP